MTRINLICAVLFVLLLRESGYCRVMTDGTGDIADTLVSALPVISDVLGENFKSRGRNIVGNKRLLGTFTITNRRGVPFILRAVFENGGEFKRDDSRFAGGESAGLELRDLELRYRNRNSAVLSKRLSPGGGRSAREARPPRDGRRSSDVERPSREGRRSSEGERPSREGRSRSSARGFTTGNGYVYEVEFLAEDVQPLYKMELWGSINYPQGGGRVFDGMYFESVNLEIEVRPDVLEAEAVKQAEEEKLNKRRK